MMSNGKKAVTNFEDQLDCCSICLESYKDPKQLPCSHVFCEQCLKRKVQKGPNGYAQLSCPKCYLIAPISPRGISSLRPPARFNHFTNAPELPTKVTGPKCGNCKKGVAKGFCHDCRLYLCRTCIQVHQSWDEWAEHELVSIPEVQEEALPPVPTKRKALYCTKHPNCERGVYCETCRELTCTECAVDVHVTHQYDFVADTFPKHQDEIQSQLHSARQQIDTVTTAFQSLDTRMTEIEDQQLAIEREIHKNIEELQKALEQRRTMLLNKLYQLTQQKLKTLATQRQHIHTLQAKLTSCVEYVEGGLKNSSSTDVLAMKEPWMKQIRRLVTDLNPEQLAPKESANLELVMSTNGSSIVAVSPTVVPTQCHVISRDTAKHASVGEQKKVTLRTVDTKGKEMSVSIKDISAELFNCTDHTITPCKVEKKEKGKYTVAYTPTTRGWHRLHIKVCQTPIGCSPLPVMVRVMPQLLKHPVQTIENVLNPKGVALNHRGQILVCEGGEKHQISVFTPDSQKLQVFGKVKTPWGVCLDGENRIAVVGHTDHQVHQFTPNGEYIQSVGSRGNNPLEFRSPTGIAYSCKSGRLYISEWGNHRIQVLNKDLSYSSTFGTQGSGYGQLSNPSGVATDSNGRVYVADHGNNRVQVFSGNGQFVRVLGSEGSGRGQLDRPQDVYVDEADMVYVADFGNDRISVFTTKGDFVTSFGEGHFTDPIGLTIDQNGFVIVSDYTRKQVLMF